MPRYAAYTDVSPAAADLETRLAAISASAGGLNKAPVFNVTDPTYGALGNGVFDCTAAIQTAITAAAAAGGGTVYFPTPAVEYVCTGQVTVPASGKVIFEGTGQRGCIVHYTGAADFLVFGADDGSHAGGANRYNGVSPFNRIRRLGLKGPNGNNTAAATASRGIVDWENGSVILEDVWLTAWGTGYSGIGADINSWRDVLVSFNGAGVALRNTSDQNSFYDLYATQNAIGVLVESSRNSRFFGGQFVGNTYADVVFDQPSTSTVTGGDIVLEGGHRFYGTWFESLVGTTTPRHVYIGRNGSSSRVVRDVQLHSCFFYLGQTTNVIEIEAGTEITLRDNAVPDEAIVSGAWIQVNTVAGLTQVVFDEDNRLPTAVTRAAGITTNLVSRQKYVGGALINQIKSTSPMQTFTAYGTAGNRLSSNGSSQLTFERNTGTEAAPVWQTNIRWWFPNGIQGQTITNGTAAPTTLPWAVGDFCHNVSVATPGKPVGWICTVAGTPGTWVPFGVVPGSSADNGDASVTLTPGTSAPTQRFDTALTANRTVTLSTTGAWNGAAFRVVRTGLGAFSLDVGGLKTIPSGTAAWVDVEFNGTAWKLSGYGTL